jgi:hypothetical protein
MKHLPLFHGRWLRLLFHVFHGIADFFAGALVEHVVDFVANLLPGGFFAAGRQGGQSDEKEWQEEEGGFHEVEER